MGKLDNDIIRDFVMNGPEITNSIWNDTFKNKLRYIQSAITGEIKQIDVRGRTLTAEQVNTPSKNPENAEEEKKDTGPSIKGLSNWFSSKSINTLARRRSQGSNYSINTENSEDTENCRERESNIDAEFDSLAESVRIKGVTVDEMKKEVDDFLTDALILGNPLSVPITCELLAEHLPSNVILTFPSFMTDVQKIEEHFEPIHYETNFTRIVKGIIDECIIKAGDPGYLSAVESRIVPWLSKICVEKGQDEQVDVRICNLMRENAAIKKQIEEMSRPILPNKPTDLKRFEKKSEINASNLDMENLEKETDFAGKHRSIDNDSIIGEKLFGLIQLMERMDTKLEKIHNESSATIIKNSTLLNEVKPVLCRPDISIMRASSGNLGSACQSPVMYTPQVTQTKPPTNTSTPATITRSGRRVRFPDRYITEICHYR